METHENGPEMIFAWNAPWQKCMVIEMEKIPSHILFTLSIPNTRNTLYYLS